MTGSATNLSAPVEVNDVLLVFFANVSHLLPPRDDLTDAMLPATIPARGWRNAGSEVA